MLVCWHQDFSTASQPWSWLRTLAWMQMARAATNPGEMPLHTSRGESQSSWGRWRANQSISMTTVYTFSITSLSEWRGDTAVQGWLTKLLKGIRWQDSNVQLSRDMWYAVCNIFWCHVWHGQAHQRDWVVRPYPVSNELFFLKKWTSSSSYLLFL